MFRTLISRAFVSFAILAVVSACESGAPTTLPDDNIPAADGIDPRSPNIERTTDALDLADVKTIRVELPTGRVTLSQAGEGAGGSIQVTEIITREGLAYDVLADLLARSTVTAARAFVNDARLDVEATVAEGLADEDIVFDVRLVVPAGANVEILVGNGPVEVADLIGNVEVRTANGAVTLAGVEGNVIAETTHRPITIMDTTGNVRAVTTDADVTLRLAPGAEGEVSAETTTGAIRITLDKATAASLNLISGEGPVSANLGGFQVTEISTGVGFLKGVLNGGGGAIEATTLTGEISFVGM